jgi:hypothetical protein
MKYTAILLLSFLASSIDAFQTNLPAQHVARMHEHFSRRAIQLNAATVEESILDIVMALFEDAPKKEYAFVGNVQTFFPGALSNLELETKVVSILAEKGFTADNTLLATSLCCDELARRLEDDFEKIYGKNFNLGGLSGFPFAGNSGFGAMAAHIPDDGSCLLIYGPHVGISKTGVVGKVERSGIKLVDTCCGSAVAASNYLKGITNGGATINTKIKSFTDFQQGAVQELILPHGKRLSNAQNSMVELPYALYDSQDILMQEIVKKGAAGAKKNGIALLGGLQINTAPDTFDYFLPLRFDYMNTKGEVIESLLGELKAD